MQVKAGATDVTTYFAMRLSANGTAATGLSSTAFDLQYVRSGAAPSAKVDATASTAPGAAHGDNKVVEVDSTDQPGLYRIDWPDAAFATGVREVILTAKVATAFTEHLRVELEGPAAMVNNEVLDVFNTDTFGEPGQEAPGATVTLETKIGYLYKFARNKITNDGSTISVFNSAGSVVDQKATVSESTAGVVTRGNFGTGP